MKHFVLQNEPKQIICSVCSICYEGLNVAFHFKRSHEHSIAVIQGKRQMEKRTQIDVTTDDDEEFNGFECTLEKSQNSLKIEKLLAAKPKASNFPLKRAPRKRLSKALRTMPMSKKNKKNRPFACKICCRRFEFKSFLSAHQQRHQNKANQHHCKNCGRYFLVFTHFESHRCI